MNNTAQIDERESVWMRARARSLIVVFLLRCGKLKQKCSNKSRRRIKNYHIQFIGITWTCESEHMQTFREPFKALTCNREYSFFPHRRHLNFLWMPAWRKNWIFPTLSIQQEQKKKTECNRSAEIIPISSKCVTKNNSFCWFFSSWACLYLWKFTVEWQEWAVGHGTSSTWLNQNHASHLIHADARTHPSHGIRS